MVLASASSGGPRGKRIKRKHAAIATEPQPRPGESFDVAPDKLLVLGTRDNSFYATRLTLNGSEEPRPIGMKRGVKYRLRLIDMGRNLPADLRLGTEEQPATWRAIAQDGATLAPQLAKSGEAMVHIASGEVYGFEIARRCRRDHAAG